LFTIRKHLLLCVVLTCGSVGPAQTGPAEVPQTDPVVSTGLAKYLNAIAEPSLLDPAEKRVIHAYRLIWRGLPSGRRVVVRLNIGADGNATVVAKVTEGGGEGRMIFQKTNKVTAQDVHGFLEVVERDDFWSSPSAEVQDAPLAKDGTSWTVEGVRDGIYHAIYRRNPKPSPYTEIGRSLAKNLAKLDDSMLSIPEYFH
jgi:hypothetical protein